MNRPRIIKLLTRKSYIGVNTDYKGMISYIIIAVVALLSFFIVLTVLKSIIKAAFVVVLILVIFSVVGAYYMVQDAREFTTTFEKENVAYILVNGENEIASFMTKGLNLKNISVKVKNPSINITIQKRFIDNDTRLYSPIEEERDRGFAAALLTTLKREEPKYLVKGIKNEQVMIQPHYLFTDVVSFAPSRLFEVKE